MVKLSSYSNGYEEGKFELKPWEFWTEEERSQVIHQAYKDHYLTSKEIKHYLDVSKAHMYTQFIVPALAGVGYFGFFKNTLAAPLYRRNPIYGFLGKSNNIQVVLLLWHWQVSSGWTWVHSISANNKSSKKFSMFCTTRSELPWNCLTICCQEQEPLSTLMFAPEWSMVKEIVSWLVNCSLRTISLLRSDPRTKHTTMLRRRAICDFMQMEIIILSNANYFNIWHRFLWLWIKDMKNLFFRKDKKDF